MAKSFEELRTRMGKLSNLEFDQQAASIEDVRERAGPATLVETNKISRERRCSSSPGLRS
jgi:hypothetical protein